MFEISPIADDLDGVVAEARAAAPYLARLLAHKADSLPDAGLAGLEAAFERNLAELRGLGAAPAGSEGDGETLRRVKRRAHLLIALGDLSGNWSLEQVTRALSNLADAAVAAALASALARHDLASSQGLFVFALGKMGARELNYSSDIDLAAFYDPDRFDGGKRMPGDSAVRVIRDMTRLLDEQTAQGYGFRTDLRLRPDPRSTPVAVSTRMAELYYESVGQNWERMVWIKARACAGDLAAAAEFQDMIRPFVWRRHLDYWALGDIHAIKRMINANVGDPDLDSVSADLKLGPGGIREIEFFAQTQQLILGGRDPALRTSDTVGALAALQAAGIISAHTEQRLRGAYRSLRAVEHRIQMLNDEQTHTLPEDTGRRAQVARLCGWRDLAAFDRALVALRRDVHEIYSDLFADQPGSDETPPQAGNLVFTGVDDDPATMRTLKGFGFGDPAQIIATVRAWHHGGVPATGSRRGQELLTALLPGLLQAMGNTGEPDHAFRHFATFFAGLRSGVQTLAMLHAEPDLLADLVSTLALAPRLARILAREPALLEALVSTGETATLLADPQADFETVMDNARRVHRDQAFLVGHRLLHGLLPATEAGATWSEHADTAVAAMAGAAERETERRFGPAPGAYGVFAMGKLGGHEMTAGSDLDLIVIYEAAPGDGGEAQQWFTRFTQRLITALSAPTAEGTLYEVDMRLRPSGRSGPVAVSLRAFEHYQHRDAWTWEHMALTRMRFIAGDAGLGSRAEEIARAAIIARSGRGEAILHDCADMRARLRRERPGAGLWDLKLAPGGLVDIEFFVQCAMLEAGAGELILANTEQALEALAAAGRIDGEEGDALLAALGVQQALQQVLRLALGDGDASGEFSSGLRDRLCRAVGAPDFDDLTRRLEAHKAEAAEIHRKKFAADATES